MKYAYIYFFVAILSLLLSGCLERSLSFQLRYEQILGLKQSDFVYFGQNKVGNVEKVSYTEQGDYLVKIKIQKEFKNTATRDSKFFIGYSPEDHKRRAVIVVQEKPGGTLLHKGDIILGSRKPDLLEMILSSVSQSSGITEDQMREALRQWRESLMVVSEQLDSELDRTLEDVAAQLQKFGKDIEAIPDSEEVKKLEEAVRQFGAQFNRAQEDIQDQIQNEILPQLQREVENLRRRLEKEGREQEVDEIERQVKDMTMV